MLRTVSWRLNINRFAIGALVIAALVGCQASRRAAAVFNPDPISPVGQISTTATHQIPKLDRVASALAGRPVIVNCWSERGWQRLQRWEIAHGPSLPELAGLTFPARRRIQLSPFDCQILQQVLERSAQQPVFEAAAVVALAHESAHASGIRAENRAECRAIRTEPRAARLLGIRASLAVRLQHIYRGTFYPHDLPSYRTPPCAAGERGILAPDTLGRPAGQRPLEAPMNAVTRLLRGWRNVGGVFSLFLSPCDPIRSLLQEQARFSETFLGPNGKTFFYTAATLRTRHEFAVALARSAGSSQCDLKLRRHVMREHHSTTTTSLHPLPVSISHLSNRVRGFREIVGDERYDSIYVFDPAKRTVTRLFFDAPLGLLPLSKESAVTQATLSGVASP